MIAQPHPFRLTIVNPETRQRRTLTVFAEHERHAKLMALRDSTEVVNCTRLRGPEASWAALSYRHKADAEAMKEFYNSIARSLAIEPSLISALTHTIPGMRSHSLRHASACAAEHLSTGQSVAEALKVFQGIIPDEHIVMIEAGDTAGETVTVFTRLAEFAERNAKAISKAKRALYYPVGLFTVGFLGFIAACMFLIPKVAAMVKSFKGELPWVTQMSMGFSDILTTYPILGIALACLPIVVVTRLSQIIDSKIVRAIVERIPLLRQLSFKISMGNSLAMFAMLLRSHVDHARALAITARVANHPKTSAFFLAMRDDVLRGENYFKAANTHRHLLGEEGFELIPYFHLGARTGDTQSLMERLAKRYQDDVDVMLSNMDRLIEPITVVVIGSLIGFVVISIVLPIVEIGVLAVPKR